MPRDKMVLAAAIAIALPIIGTSLAHIPAIGPQLTAVCANLQLGVAGALATAVTVLLYELVMGTFTSLAGTTSAGAAAAAR